ncbi:MAG TPA: ACT domain-containing protein [Thermoanaerobaculia bacterium]|nr:ACT domain-containing protein [Thermoanaerobaculia bacterium]
MSEIVSPRSTEEVITHSTFRFAGTFLWASAREVRTPSKHLMVARDEKETTVVTTPELLHDVDVIALNRDRWLLLSIDCAHPFYCVGVIAQLSSKLSDAGLDILVVSTFSRDWVFVKEEDGARAADVLIGAGFRRSEQT